MAGLVPREMLAAHRLRTMGVVVSLHEYSEDLPAIVRDDMLLLAECAAARAAARAKLAAAQGGHRGSA